MLQCLLVLKSPYTIALCSQSLSIKNILGVKIMPMLSIPNHIINIKCTYLLATH